MTKSLLSLTLILTQLLSWSASPLYLCLDDDGSVCVDFGPDGCQCCQQPAADGHACVAEHGTCKDHDHNNSERQRVDSENALAAGPCDCTHIQILQTQTVTVVSSSVSRDVQRLAVCLATPSFNLVAHVAIPPIDEAAMLLRLMHSPAPSLTVSASAVMQC